MYAFQQIEDELAAYWPGVGAKPGANLAPRHDEGSAIGASCNTKQYETISRYTTREREPKQCTNGRVPVMSGLAIGPNGFDTLTADSIPTNCAPAAMPFNMPWRTVTTDPMDKDHMWTVPTSGTEKAENPYQPWTYSLGGWP